MHPFPFYFITNWHCPQDNQWIVVLEDNHETNFHFIFVWTIYSVDNNVTMTNFLVRNRPWDKWNIYWQNPMPNATQHNFLPCTTNTRTVLQTSLLYELLYIHQGAGGLRVLQYPLEKNIPKTLNIVPKGQYLLSEDSCSTPACWWNSSLLGLKGRNLHKFEYVSKPFYYVLKPGIPFWLTDQVHPWMHIQ